MRIGIYAREDSKAPITDLAVGLMKLGHEAVFRRPNFFKESDADKFDVVAVLGQRPECNKRILRHYLACMIPVLLLDHSPLQHIHDAQMHCWYAGWNGYGWLPDKLPENSARAEKFHIYLTAPVKRKKPKEGHILYCGQVPGDAFHGLSEDQMIQRFRQEISEIRRHSNRKIIFRAHPHYPKSLIWDVGADEMQSNATNLHHFLENSVHALVTVNSNSCIDAIRSGVPAFVTGVSAYSRIVNTDLSQIENPVIPDLPSVAHFYERYAHTSWERSEYLDGTAARFMLERIPDVF